MKKEDIHIIYGNNPLHMTYEILTQMHFASQLRPDMRIGIKPNLVVARQASGGATTHPEIVEGVIQYLREQGITNIAIMEGSWVGDSTKRAFKVCGYEELARKYQIPLYDLKEDASVSHNVNGLDIRVCRKPLEVDMLINIPVLKAHCQTLLTCALKNLKGCIPDSEKRRFHSLGLHKPIGSLAKLFPNVVTIIDALNGDLTFEEGGNPVRMDRIIAGQDPVLLDTYAAALLGYDIDEIEYIGIAEKAGAGSANLSRADIYEYDIGLKNGNRFEPSPAAQRLAKKVVAKDACSACYGSLIHALQRLSDQDRLRLLREPIYIGQQFRGQEIQGIGVGTCTKGCSVHLPGCPPTAKSIVGFLESQITKR